MPRLQREGYCKPINRFSTFFCVFFKTQKGRKKPLPRWYLCSSYFLKPVTLIVKTKMQNFKIIETCCNFPDVLLRRDRDEDGVESVKILAMGVICGIEDMFATEEIKFENLHTAVDYIHSFTKTNAENWCKRQQITF